MKFSANWTRFLRSADARAILTRIWGAGSFANGALWSNGACLFLAVAVAKHLNSRVLLLLEDEDEWIHAAAELPRSGLWLDSEAAEHEAELVKAWPTATLAKKLTPDEAAQMLDPDERAELPNLIALLRREFPTCAPHEDE